MKRYHRFDCMSKQWFIGPQNVTNLKLVTLGENILFLGISHLYSYCEFVYFKEEIQGTLLHMGLIENWCHTRRLITIFKTESNNPRSKENRISNKSPLEYPSPFFSIDLNKPLSHRLFPHH